MTTSIVDAIGRIPLSGNLTATLARAAEYAGAQSHVEVGLEHLLLALTEDADASLVLGISRVDVEALKGDVSSQLGRIEERLPTGTTAELRISADLRQILEAAAAAAEGRRREIDGAIVLAAIVGEGKSSAAHLLRAHGLTFETAIRALQQAAAVSQPPQQPERPAATGAPPAGPRVGKGSGRNDAGHTERAEPTDTATQSAAASAPLDAERQRPAAQPAPSHHSTSSAEDILASARQRVQDRAGPGRPDLQAATETTRPPAEVSAHRDGPTTEPVRQPDRADALAAAEARTDAEFDRIAAEAARVTIRRKPASESQPPQHVDSLDDIAEPPSATVAPATRAAPPAPRPSPPGALRPNVGHPAGQQSGPPLPVTQPAGVATMPTVIVRRETAAEAGRPAAPPPRQEQSGANQVAGAGLTQPMRPPVFEPQPGPPPHGMRPPLPAGPSPANTPAPPLPHPPGRPATSPAGASGSDPVTQPGQGSYQHGYPQPGQWPPGPVPQPNPRTAPPRVGVPPPTAPAPGPAPQSRDPFGPLQVQPANMARPPSPQPAAAAPPVARATTGAPRALTGATGATVAIGQLVENIPRRMRVAVPSLVEVRIARGDIKAVAAGMQGASATFRHELSVTKAMAVRLRAPDGGFFIETASPETQWIDNVQGLMSDDFASWRWTVTPRRKGRKRLQLVISARTVGSDGLTAETQLPDQIVDIVVRSNYGQALKRVAGWAAAAVLGGTLARFGEDLPQVVASLTQLLTK